MALATIPVLAIWVSKYVIAKAKVFTIANVLAGIPTRMHAGVEIAITRNTTTAIPCSALLHLIVPTIYLSISEFAQATIHDSILTIYALNEVRKVYPDITFRHFLADGAMDNYPTYRLLQQSNMIPYIPLNSRTRIDYTKPHPGILCFDDDRNPVCMGGIPYQHAGLSYPKSIKYCC